MRYVEDTVYSDLVNQLDSDKYFVENVEAELRRLGADITLAGQSAEIWGVDSLHGTVLNATDLRGGAAMIVAGLAAEGQTLVCDEGHIRRGYESFDARLRALGADVCLDH